MKNEFDFDIVAITMENKTTIPNNFLFDNFTRDEPLQVMKTLDQEIIEHFNHKYYDKLSANGELKNIFKRINYKQKTIK